MDYTHGAAWNGDNRFWGSSIIFFVERLGICMAGEGLRLKDKVLEKKHERLVRITSLTRI
ncbi:hypothetical protein [Paenibacillus sp. FSL K6-1230]|uniref:hypothetical protein n=1 Tax=Paenibacillus sp. FSL K6-1230 TaxID=2921603 RepID=UPI00039C7E9C